MNKERWIVVERSLVDELIEWLSAPQRTGGNFPMETHRAESEGVDHLLSGLCDARDGRPKSGGA